MNRIHRALLTLMIITPILSCHGPGISMLEENDNAILFVVSGLNQQGENGERLHEPVVIRVTDDENRPLVNVRLVSHVVDGGGALDDEIMYSDKDGCAQTFWTLGNGSEHIMKVTISDRDYSGESVYVFAQTTVDLNLGWVTDVSFPRLYDRDIAHDNRILESNHYLIFSDGSSDDAKVRFAMMAEETFYEVMQAFHIHSSEELGILQYNRNTKPKLFSNVDTVFPYGGFAFNTGYVYYAFDSQTYLQWPEHLKTIYRADIKHETVHIVQFLVGMDNLPNLWPDVWFSEGLAVYISNNRPPPANLQELNEWLQIPENDNPIKVHEWEDYPYGGRRYYQMFGLAVKYLIHENGHSRTTIDVLDMYRYMASSRNGFADAFEKFMGMSLQYYEDNYWDLITDFLE